MIKKITVAMTAMIAMTSSCGTRDQAAQSLSKPSATRPVDVSITTHVATRTFAEWCKDATASRSAMNTIGQLLVEAETNDCDAAEQILKTKRYFSWLASVDVDVSPLSSLPMITGLSVEYATGIVGLETLKNLTHLETLGLYDNKLQDIHALANIPTLKSLDISNNKITDISALSSLKNLYLLDVRNNQLPANTPCPVTPAAVCRF